MLDNSKPDPAANPTVKAAWELGEIALRATEGGVPPVDPKPRDKKRES